MQFRVHDGACDALLPGAVGTLAGHLGAPYTCGCGRSDCPEPTPAPPAPPDPAEGADDGHPEGADGDDSAAPAPEPPPVGHLWLEFAEDQLTEAKRARRGTLPVPEPEPVVCATCDGSLVIHLAAQRNENRLVVDVPALPEGATEITIPHGMAREAIDAPAAVLPAEYRTDTVEAFGYDHDDDDTAEFEVDPEGAGADYTDDGYDDDEYEPEPLVPELIEVLCPTCGGTGWAPPPPPPMIPRNPSPFRAGVRADQADLLDTDVLMAHGA